MLKKPKKFERKIEIDPLEVFNKVAEKSTKFKINYGNTTHLEYLERRKDLINTIESLCILQNSDQETFFQAVLYLDKIIFQQKLSEYIEKIPKENSGNNLDNESIFFKNFIKTELTEFNRIEDYCRSDMLVSRNVIDFDHLFVSLAVGCFNISSKLYFKFYSLHKLNFYFFFHMAKVKQKQPNQKRFDYVGKIKSLLNLKSNFVQMIFRTILGIIILLNSYSFILFLMNTQTKQSNNLKKLYNLVKGLF